MARMPTLEKSKNRTFAAILLHFPLWHCGGVARRTLRWHRSRRRPTAGTVSFFSKNNGLPSIPACMRARRSPRCSGQTSSTAALAQACVVRSSKSPGASAPYAAWAERAGRNPVLAGAVPVRRGPVRAAQGDGRDQSAGVRQRRAVHHGCDRTARRFGDAPPRHNIPNSGGQVDFWPTLCPPNIVLTMAMSWGRTVEGVQQRSQRRLRNWGVSRDPRFSGFEGSLEHQD